MRHMIIVVLCLLSFMPIPAQGSRHCRNDPTPMYDAATLSAWQEQYGNTPAKLLSALRDGVTTPSGQRRLFMTSEERQALQNVRIDVPLQVTENQYAPLTFYAHSPTRTVTVPVFSQKFLEDLVRAYAWLHLNNHDVASVFDYVAMLSHRAPDSFPGCRYPSPLEAMAIPANAFDDPVDELAVRIFVNARAFILIHELGHIRFQHEGYLPGQPRSFYQTWQIQQEELAADRFAVDIMSRTGDIPIGAAFLFMAFAHQDPNRWHFESESEWEDYLRTHATHPLSSNRTRSLGRYLEEHASAFGRQQVDFSAGVEQVRWIATELKELADFLDDLDIQQAVIVAAAATTLEALQDRSDRQRKLHAMIAFHGIYKGALVNYNDEGREEVAVEINFQRAENQVLGSFNFGLSRGTIRGTVRDDTLVFEWRWSLWSGWGRMVASQDGNELQGTWGYDRSQEGGGTWHLERERESSPEPRSIVPNEAAVQSNHTRLDTSSVSQDTLVDEEVKRLKAYLDGRRISATWREGGTVYGWYYSQDIHFCNDNYELIGRGERHTILDNREYRNWREAGEWDVIRHEGESVLLLRPSRSTQEERIGQNIRVPLTLLPNGRISVPGYNIPSQGYAEC